MQVLLSSWSRTEYPRLAAPRIWPDVPSEGSLLTQLCLGPQRAAEQAVHAPYPVRSWRPVRWELNSVST